MKIFYGLTHNKIDVTDICLSNLTNNNIIKIPFGDSNRARIFSDPIPGILKVILILNEETDELSMYDDSYDLIINIEDNTININSIITDVSQIHSKLTIKHGSFNEELPEQRMAVRYLTGHEKVLELGANIGRNSLIIGYILNQQNNNNFVTLETDPDTVLQLTENRDLNNFSFHIEGSALSNRKLIQKGWETIESDTLLEGYKLVNTITLDELYSKYNIDFDTLILDCEGAFYYILMDMPQILNNINLICMENDYWDIEKKEYIDTILLQNNFYRDYVEGGGWGPCHDNFFEVWKKVNLN